jgi:hypothetical protein
MMISRHCAWRAEVGIRNFGRTKSRSCGQLKDRSGATLSSLATSGTRAARRMRLLNTRYQLPCDIENNGSS